MIKIVQISILVLLVGVLLHACEDEKNTNVDFNTGLNCTVKYGQGDCMPMIGGSNRKYNDYSGKVFIISKRAYDKLMSVNCNCIIDSELDSLKNNSIVLNIMDGKLIKELQPDSFLVFIDAEFTNSNENLVYIKNQAVLTKDISFFNCTSY